MRKISVRRLVRAMLFLGCAVGLLLPAALALATYGLRMGLEVPWLETLTVLGVVALGGLLAHRWPDRWDDGVLLTVPLLLLTACKLVFVLSLTQPPQTDAAILWRLAGVVAEEGVEGLALEDGYSQILAPRIFPYLLPLRLLFGPEATSYTVSNVLVASLTAIVAYLFTRDHFGRRAARVAGLFALLAPDPFLHALVPAHDLPGAFFTLAALLVGSRARAAAISGRRRVSWVYVLAFAVLVFLAHLQRDVGSFLLLACAATAIATGPLSMASLRRAAPYVAGMLAVLGLLEAGLRLAGLPSRDRTEYARLAILGFTDSWGDGTWYHYHHDYWLKGYLPARLAAEWQPRPGEPSPPEVLGEDFLKRKLVSDLYYNPGERLGNYFRKARTLLRFESLDDWYLLGALEQPEVDRVSRLRVVFAVPFLSLFLVGGIRLWSAGENSFAALPLVYLAAVCGAMILLSEVQSRYLYLLWFVGPIYIGSLFSERTAHRDGSAPRPGASNGSPPP